jgi:hypothetical protein
MVYQFLKHAGMKMGIQFAKNLGRVLHQLWHEITATLFLFFGLALMYGAFKAWRAPDLHTRAIFATIMSVMMIYFGITSFMRAKKVGQKS